MPQNISSTSISAIIFLLLGYVIQNLGIYPMELQLRSYESVQLYSLCYIPHGFKAIVFGILGGWAVLPVIFAQTIGGTMVYEDTAHRALEGAIIGSGCFFLSLVSFNYYRNVPLFSRIVYFEFRSSNRPFNLLLFGFWATIVNSIVSNLYWGAAENYLFLKFAIGDLIGAFIAISLLLILRQLLYQSLIGRRK
jgi:riboflavin transporter FmnP